MSNPLNLLSKIYNHHFKARTITFLVLIFLTVCAFYNLIHFSKKTVNELTDNYHWKIALEPLRLTEAVINCRSQCTYTYISSKPNVDPFIVLLACNKECVDDLDKEPGKFLIMYEKAVPKSRMK